MLGSFSSERDKVESYWNAEVKTAIADFQKTNEPSKLLEVSEKYFGLTNTMVDAAQSMVNIMTYFLYLLLIGFAASVGLSLKKVYAIFQERVVEPIGTLEGSINKLAQGNLNQKLVYNREDEIGKLYRKAA